MVEGARLESVYTSKAYRGFESLLLRHHPFQASPNLTKKPCEPFTIQGFTVQFVSAQFAPSQTHLGVDWG